jgi:hypothetical protein
MKLSTVATALILGLALISCNENEPQKAQTQPPPEHGKFLKSLQQGQTTFSPNVQANQQAPGVPAARELSLPGANLTPLPDPATAVQQTVVNIPPDARWTLYCASISGPDRISRMAQLKNYLVQKSPMKDWYVVHDEQNSTLFYGFYSNVEKSERGSARAHADRKAISEWRDGDERPFAACFFTQITPPNPVAPPEWNLANAPADAAWSVQIAAFKDDVKRKQAAVDAVRELREKGIIAFYYHGNAVSSVCIGAWPEDALKRQEMDGSRAVVDEDQAMLVSQGPLPAQFKNARTKDGQRVVPFTQRIEIADSSLKATLDQYPYHYVNYDAQSREVRTASGKVERVPAPSFLVKIPRDPNAVVAGGGNGGARGLLSPDQRMPAPVNASQQPAGAGRLRGLGN